MTAPDRQNHRCGGLCVYGIYLMRKNHCTGGTACMEDRADMRAIAVISPKGGTGKSSLSQALAVAAARDGPSVLFDRDPQGTSARWFSVQRAAPRRAPL